MAIKTFTAGSVLTASDTNTFLANAGLVYVKSQTIGNGVTSVTVSSAFTAEFDAYRILCNGGTMSANTNLGLRLGSTTTGYYGNFVYGNYSNNAVANQGEAGTSYFGYAGGGNADGVNLVCDVFNPFLTKRTYLVGTHIMYSTFGGAYYAQEISNSSHTAFTLLPSSGTMTGGTITVYGYRKA